MFHYYDQLDPHGTSGFTIQNTHGCYRSHLHSLKWANACARTSSATSMTTGQTCSRRHVPPGAKRRVSCPAHGPLELLVTVVEKLGSAAGALASLRAMRALSMAAVRKGLALQTPGTRAFAMLELSLHVKRSKSLPCASTTLILGLYTVSLTLATKHS